MPKGLKLLVAIFLFVGILLLAIGLSVTASRVHLEQVGTTAHGRVIRVQPRSGRHGIDYCPVVEFQTNYGEKIIFTSSMGSSRPSFHPGEVVAVLYDPGDPKHAYIRSFMEFWGTPVVVCALGLIFGGIPIGILLTRARGRSRAHWLKQNGQRISTKLDRVEQVTSITVNGAHPYRIISQGQDPFSGEVRIFHSYNLWTDPSPFVAERPIDVLIDPNNPKRYWLDTDFLTFIT